MELDCLGVGAHPDDMEILAGGLLALLSRRGKRTGILDLTRGEAGTNGTPQRRRRESAAAAKVLGLRVRRNLGLPDSALEDNLPSRRRLAQAIRELRPHAVVTMPGEDHHPDHVAASRLVFGACWLAGLANAKGLKGRAFRPAIVLHAVGHRTLEPDLVVDVTEAWGTKMKAMRCYASQFTGKGKAGTLTFIDRPGFLDLIEARGRILGFRIGTGYGEAYRVKGPLAVRDPWGAILSAGAVLR